MLIICQAPCWVLCLISCKPHDNAMKKVVFLFFTDKETEPEEI